MQVCFAGGKPRNSTYIGVPKDAQSVGIHLCHYRRHYWRAEPRCNAPHPVYFATIRSQSRDRCSGLWTSYKSRGIDGVFHAVYAVH